MIGIKAAFLPTVALAVTLIGCIDTDEVAAPREPMSAGGSIELGGDITYSGTVQPILLTNCSLCHNPSSLTGGLDATTYEGLFAAPGFVAPGDPEASLLLAMLESGAMPPPGNPGPSDEEIAAVREWITQGASNN